MGSIRSVENDKDLLIAAAEIDHATISRQARPTESHSTVPHWLWWNILSLDAPAVAVVWALLFARAGHVEVPPPAIAVLGLIVWAIYLADRLLDGWSTVDQHLLKARHRFCERHPALISVLGGLAALAGTFLAYEGLDAAGVRAGMVLAGLVGAYMLCVHLGGSAASRLFPKEMVVGLLFAAGTSLPVWSQPRLFSWDGLFSWLLFALVCILNCVAIESWEGQIALGPAANGLSRGLTWAARHIATFATAVAVLGVGGLFLLRSDSYAIAAAGTAALLILLLNSVRAHLSGHALRILADVALLIPAIFALLLRR